jgi:hypothetical protein
MARTACQVAIVILPGGNLWFSVAQYFEHMASFICGSFPPAATGREASPSVSSWSASQVWFKIAIIIDLPYYGKSGKDISKAVSWCNLPSCTSSMMAIAVNNGHDAVGW